MNNETILALASSINHDVNKALSEGNSDLDILKLIMSDRMDTIKELLDTASEHKMDELCDKYDGFYHFMKILERLAQNIADGKIPIPDGWPINK
jgi:hypothetical protein